MAHYRAKETATGEFPDGRVYYFSKGDVLPEGHEVVQWDLQHGGLNWAILPEDEPEPKTPSARAVRAARAAT